MHDGENPARPNESCARRQRFQEKAGNCAPEEPFLKESNRGCGEQSQAQNLRRQGRLNRVKAGLEVENAQQRHHSSAKKKPLSQVLFPVAVRLEGMVDFAADSQPAGERPQKCYRAQQKAAVEIFLEGIFTKDHQNPGVRKRMGSPVKSGRQNRTAKQYRRKIRKNFTDLFHLGE